MLLPNEQAALARLRRCKNGESLLDVYSDDIDEANHGWELDATTIVNVFCREHPEDDTAAVTEEWLKSVGWEIKDSNNWPAVKIPSSKITIAWRAAGVWIVETNTALCLTLTRGDVRRLCSALGIDLDTSPPDTPL